MWLTDNLYGQIFVAMSYILFSFLCIAEQQILVQQQIVQIRDEISRRDQDILLLQSQLRDAEQILVSTQKSQIIEG